MRMKRIFEQLCISFENQNNEQGSIIRILIRKIKNDLNLCSRFFLGGFLLEVQVIQLIVVVLLVIVDVLRLCAQRKISFIITSPILRTIELVSCTICQIWSTLSSATLATTQGSDEFQLKSDTLAV
jgi:hypothetical protein